MKNEYIPDNIGDYQVISSICEFLLHVEKDYKDIFIQLELSDFVKNILYYIINPVFSEPKESKSWGNYDFIEAKVLLDEEVKKRIIELAAKFSNK